MSTASSYLRPEPPPIPGLSPSGNQREGRLLRPEVQELKFTLHRKLLDKINVEALAATDERRVRHEVQQALLTLIDGEPALLNTVEREQIASQVLDEIFGLGPLECLFDDPTISDILVNGARTVYVERGGLLELTKLQFRDDQHLMRIIDRIVSKVGRRVDESNPMVDARLMDGSRVNAIIPPLAVDGPLLSIRRFSRDKLSPQDLVEKRAISPAMMQLLESAVKARLNIVIVGGTGAGKTTLLNALSAFIPSNERIITIEDAAELQLKQPHVARLEFIARSMRAGHAFSVSLETLHRECEQPLAGEFRRVFEEQNLGMPLDAALTRLVSRVRLIDIQFFVSAVALQRKTGGNLTEILDTLAEVIRERYKLKGKVKAISAHGRMTAQALSAIPIIVGAMMFWVNAEYSTFFFHTTLGLEMLAGAVALQIIAYVVIMQIVTIEI